MNNRPFLPRASLAVLLCGLSACSTIKSWFPDKERDYQFTSEIPELIVPEDLKARGLPTVSAEPQRSAAERVTAAETAVESVPADAVKQEPQPTAAEQTADTQPAAQYQPAQQSGGSSLQIDQGQKQAARLVARAMSRQKLEIVERNLDKGFFYVKFDPAAVKASDDSIFDEFNFMFGDDPSQEEEYRISLHEIGAQLTEVTVQDSEGKTLSNVSATELLRLIAEGITQDIPAESTEPASSQPAEKKPATEQPKPETTTPEAKPQETPAAENPPAAESE